jgi:hypothetical protein
MVLAACASPAARSTPVVSAAAPQASAPVARAPRVSIPELERLFGVDPTPALANDARDVGSYRDWVRAILREPAPYKVLTPLILGVFTELPSDRVVGFLPLLEGQSKTKGAFYYRRETCADDALRRVRPWWNASTEVWICGDDYRPDLLEDKGVSCDVMWPLPDGSRCGCGPNLVFCGTKELQSALKKATREEQRLTLEHLVESERPFGEIVTMNGTVRSGLGDLFVARTELFVSGRFTPPDIASPPTLRPRPYPFQGGLLSTPLFLFGDSQRSMIASIWETFFCLRVVSREVATQTILEALHSETAFRERDVLGLARTEGCQNCHARLEHGQAFMAGWQSWLKGMHYVPEVAAATPVAQFYLRDHHDMRGERPATLGALGALIASQPEFGRCMVSKATSFVYEGTAVPYEVERRLLQGFANGQNMRALIEDAVVARAFGADALGDAARGAP